MVFHGGSGQAQAVAGLQAPQGPGAATAGIFDHLGFVQDHQVKGLCGQRVQVAPQQRVGGQHQVVIRHLRKQRFALRPLQGQQAQARSHALCFKLPVEDEGGGQHHQNRQVEPSGVLFNQHMGQRLCGFTEAHVIGQDAAQVVRAQVLQPGYAFELIGPQLHLQAFGRSHRLRGT